MEIEEEITRARIEAEATTSKASRRKRESLRDFLDFLLVIL